MDAHQEIELKWALDADGHRRLDGLLAAELGPPQRLEQRNRFYDSPDRRLRAAGLNLRLREENGRLLLTCKRRVAEGDGLHHHEEWERWLETPPDEPPRAADLPLPEAWRVALAGSRLEAVGGFANLRHEFHAAGELLCLDRTDFMGRRTDHELEIETTDASASAARWRARLAAWGVPWRPQPLTKFARMLELLRAG
jgi:uncharacterized protein YjbK